MAEVFETVLQLKPLVIYSSTNSSNETRVEFGSRECDKKIQELAYLVNSPVCARLLMERDRKREQCKPIPIVDSTVAFNTHGAMGSASHIVPVYSNPLSNREQARFISFAIAVSSPTPPTPSRREIEEMEHSSERILVGSCREAEKKVFLLRNPLKPVIWVMSEQEANEFGLQTLMDANYVRPQYYLDDPTVTRSHSQYFSYHIYEFRCQPVKRFRGKAVSNGAVRCVVSPFAIVDWPTFINRAALIESLNPLFTDNLLKFHGPVWKKEFKPDPNDPSKLVPVFTWKDYSLLKPKPLWKTMFQDIERMISDTILGKDTYYGQYQVPSMWEHDVIGARLNKARVNSMISRTFKFEEVVPNLFYDDDDDY